MTQHIAQYLLDAGKQEPDRAAIEMLGMPFTYGALAHASSVLATGLRSLGIADGCAVGLLMPNIPQFVQALYGSWIANNVVVPMNVLLTAAEIRYIAEDSQLQAIFVFERFVPQVEAAIAELASPPRIIVVGATTKHVPYETLVRGHPRAEPPSAVPHRHILTIYTSGTTGKPKGAVITNDNLIAQLDMTDGLFPPERGDRALCVLPLFHVFALNAVLNTAIRHRTTVVLHAKFELDATVRSLTTGGITVFSGVPTMYFYLLRHPDAIKYGFPTLRHCISGGAAMPLDVLQAFEQQFRVPIYEGYGLTETTVSICCNRPGAKRAGSVGQPLPGVQLKVADDDNHEVVAGERGELIVKSANVMQGYLGRPEATAEAIVDGWLHTGDVAYIDDDGFVFIVDRKKDLIIKGGYNIYPREIEEVLYKLPQIAEAAVVGVHDAAKGERVRAVISVRPGMTLEQPQVEQHLSEQLAKYKLPTEYVFLAELPKGPTGKILKRELRAEQL